MIDQPLRTHRSFNQSSRRSTPTRRIVGAAAVVCLFALSAAACGDDDDDTPSEQQGPEPTGANQAPEGNVDVTNTIAEPEVQGSNLGELSSQAPYNSEGQ